MLCSKNNFYREGLEILSFFVAVCMFLLRMFPLPAGYSGEEVMSSLSNGDTIK